MKQSAFYTIIIAEFQHIYIHSALIYVLQLLNTYKWIKKLKNIYHFINKLFIAFKQFTIFESWISSSLSNMKIPIKLSLLFHFKCVTHILSFNSSIIIMLVQNCSVRFFDHVWSFSNLAYRMVAIIIMSRFDCVTRWTYFSFNEIVFRIIILHIRWSNWLILVNISSLPKRIENIWNK